VAASNFFYGDKFQYNTQNNSALFQYTDLSYNNLLLYKNTLIIGLNNGKITLNNGTLYSNPDFIQKKMNIIDKGGGFRYAFFIGLEDSNYFRELVSTEISPSPHAFG